MSVKYSLISPKSKTGFKLSRFVGKGPATRATRTITQELEAERERASRMSGKIPPGIPANQTERDTKMNDLERKIKS